MENFNILGVHLKILLLEGGSRKNNIKGGGGGWTVCPLKGDWVRKVGGVFEGRRLISQSLL